MLRRQFLRTLPAMGLGAGSGCQSIGGLSGWLDGSRQIGPGPGIDWRQLPGPSGGPVTDLVVSRADPDWVYATTRTSGMFVTSTGGSEWRQGFSGQHHRPSVWASPHDPQVAYTRIERTDDGGRTWYGDHVGSDKPAMDRHGPIGGLDNPVYAMAWDAGDPDVIYAAAAEGFYRTFDDGRSWEHRPLDVDLPPSYRGWDVAAHPSEPGRLVVGLGSTVASSEDHGERWSVTDVGAIEPRTRDRFIRGVAYAEVDADDVYLAVEGDAVYRLSGSDLVELTPSLPSLVYPKNDLPLSVSADRETLYFVAGRSDEMYEVRHWWDDRRLYAYDRTTGEVGVVETRERPNAVATHPTDDGLYVGGDEWVHVSRDGGRTWTARPDGFIDGYLATVGVNPSESGTVVAGSLCSTGISVSYDAGTSFEWKRSGLRPWHPGEFGEHYVMQIAARGDRVYVTTAAGLLRSEDNGATWELLDTTFSGSGSYEGTYDHLHGLAVHPSDPETLYVGTGMGGAGGDDAFDEAMIWWSTDGGATWAERGTGLPEGETTIQDIVVSEHDPAVVYAGTNREDYIATPAIGRGYGLFRSTDAGGTWERVQAPFVDVHAIVEPPDDGRLYVSTPSGVFRTDEAGKWNRVLEYESKALVAHPARPGVVFAAARTAQSYWDVLVSTDGGETWLDGDLTVQVGAEAAARTPDAVEGHSHYWGHNGDINWFALDESEERLYAATRGTGLWRADIGSIGE